MDNNSLIELHDVAKVYEMGETQVSALQSVTYTIRQGDLLAVMGPSGSGKSTLMNIIGCLDKPSSGRYLLDGKEVSTYDRNQLAGIRNKKIGFVFPNPWR
jgi:putative ABC transport system ATP-binding protein